MNRCTEVVNHSDQQFMGIRLVSFFVADKMRDLLDQGSRDVGSTRQLQFLDTIQEFRLRC